jgi:hypothetical protein
MNRRTALRTTLGTALAAALAPRPAAAQPAPPPAPPPSEPFRLRVEPRAVEIVKAAAAKLAAARSMAFTAIVGYEAPSRLGPPLLYTVRYDTAFVRPDKLKVLTLGDGPAAEFVYDGRTMIAYAPAEDLAAQAAAPPTLDAAMRAAYDTAGIYFPFVDLLLPDPYAGLSEGLNLAFVIGQSNVVGGIRTDMVAWANNDVFLQMWIGADDHLPRRLRAVYSSDPARLRHDMDLSNWQIDPGQADTAASARARSGKPIPFAHPGVPK